MIIIRSDDDAAATAAIERALKGQDIDIFQSDDDLFTTEQLLNFIAYNAKQTRVYVGRLERNTRRMEEDMRSIAKLLEPLATYATFLLAETAGDEETASEFNQLRKRREQRVAKQDALNPPRLGGGRS